MLAPDELGSERLFGLVHYRGNGGKMTKKGLDEHEVAHREFGLRIVAGKRSGWTDRKMKD